MNVVSLFAGCGGLDLGFSRAGFNVLWANEYDEAIFETYRKNHPYTILNTKDIRTLPSSEIPDCDGIIGGPPCQSWSEGGLRLGIDDPRGRLFFDFIRIVSEKKPKFFVIENVKGILDCKHHESLRTFVTMLTDAGYNVKYKLLNAVDFKIPQDRQRVFFVGIRNDFTNRFNFPTATCIMPITLRQAIGDIVETPQPYNKQKVNGAQTLFPNNDVYIGPYDEKFMARNRVRSWDEVSFTIQALAKNAPLHPQAPKMQLVAKNRMQFVQGFEHLYRRLSVRECARIQTFPDSFIFYYSDIKDGYKMVGNAVPPRLAFHIALEIVKCFSV